MESDGEEQMADYLEDLDHNQERPQFETQIVAPQTMPELVKVDKLSRSGNV